MITFQEWNKLLSLVALSDIVNMSYAMQMSDFSSSRAMIPKQI